MIILISFRHMKDDAALILVYYLYPRKKKIVECFLIKRVGMTCHSSYYYSTIIVILRYFVSYNVKHHFSRCHIIPFMTQIDNVDINADEAINILIKAIPGLFGPHAPDNTLKNLITTPTTRNRIKSVQESKYKIHLIAKGEEISRLGFPLDSIELILDDYTKQSWS